MKKTILFSALCLLTILSSCRNENDIIGSTDNTVTEGTDGAAKGFYLLNEGQMGANNSTLDYFDATTGVYSRNIFAERNPSVIKELGDTGNDLKIHNGRLYAVMNGSHKVAVMTADSAKFIADVDIPNGRYICFEGDYAYVSSYMGAAWGNGDIKGAVYKFHTTTLQVVGSVEVGYQPEELAIVDGKLYVANSGGMTTTYDNTVSVIDLATFTVSKKITVSPNLHRLRDDGKGHLYISSRGSYYDIAANLYVVDTQSDAVVDTLNIGVSNLCIAGNTAYTYNAEWNYTTSAYDYAYRTIDLNTRVVTETQYITDDTELSSLYGITVNPDSRDVILTDAGDYVNSGTVFCFSPEGTLRWQVDAGTSPAHIAWYY